MKFTDRIEEMEESCNIYSIAGTHTNWFDTSRTHCHNDAEDIYKLPVDHSLAFFLLFASLVPCSRSHI